MKLGVFLLIIGSWWGFWGCVYGIIEFAKGNYGGAFVYVAFPMLLLFFGVRRLRGKRKFEKSD